LATDEKIIAPFDHRLDADHGLQGSFLRGGCKAIGEFGNQFFCTRPITIARPLL
jgi:hypothetical protein